MKIFTLAVLSIGFIFQSANAQSVLAKRIDSLLAAKTNTSFNGIILIAQGDQPQYFKIKGYSDLEKKTKLRPEDEFVIGSISKQFTAAVVLLEYEKGRIDLNTPIHKYLPELSQSWADTVTVHHLLTHTHGIRELNEPAAFPAGTQYEYSQIGYDLLAKIAERVSGKSFAALSAAMFQKCGMKQTFHPDTKGYHLVKGYSANASGQLFYDTNSLKNYPAAGGFISTVNDLLIWNNALQNGKVLKPETLKMATSEQKNAIRNHPLFGKTKYGYGLTVDTKGDLLQIGQTGSAPGFISINFYYPKTKTSFIILDNVVYYPQDLVKTFQYHVAIWKIVRESLGATDN